MSREVAAFEHHQMLLRGRRAQQLDEPLARRRPATWELETYGASQEAFSVGGISWFEAAAYGDERLPRRHRAADEGLLPLRRLPGQRDIRSYF
jgi:hypothetical protein